MPQPRGRGKSRKQASVETGDELKAGYLLISRSAALDECIQELRCRADEIEDVEFPGMFG